MTAEARYFPRARLDLIEQADYLAEQASTEVAERFLASTERTVDELLEMPRMGRIWEGLQAETQNIRIWRVRDFPKILIFYRIETFGICVVRVLHGARDLPSLMKDYL